MIELKNPGDENATLRGLGCHPPRSGRMGVEYAPLAAGRWHPPRDGSAKRLSRRDVEVDRVRWPARTSNPLGRVRRVRWVRLPPSSAIFLTGISSRSPAADVDPSTVTGRTPSRHFDKEYQGSSEPVRRSASSSTQPFEMTHHVLPLPTTFLSFLNSTLGVSKRPAPSQRGVKERPRHEHGREMRVNLSFRTPQAPLSVTSLPCRPHACE